MKKTIIILAATVILLTYSISAFDTALLAVCYNADNLTDYTGYTADLTNNSNVYLIPGNQGNAWYLNQSPGGLQGKVQLANQFSPTTGTIMFWTMYYGKSNVNYGYLYCMIDGDDLSHGRFGWEVEYSPEGEIHLGFGGSWIDTNIIMPKNSWQHYALTWNSSGWFLYNNGTFLTNGSTLGWASTNWSGGSGVSGAGIFHEQNNNELIYNGTIDSMSIWNRSLSATEILDAYLYNYDCSFVSESGQQPPAITYVNCSSCSDPNGDSTPPYTTEDTTPTFRITTDKISLCRIGALDQNYTTMNSSRDCDSEWLTTHVCTLKPEDELLVNEIDYVYISCEDTMSTENKTSTSGPLEMQITSPQTGVLGVNAIERGINSSIANPIIYSNQKVYVRTASNGQALATFDKVCVYGNQRWAFNYLTANETYSTFYNLTPVFYFMEMTDLTITEIIDSVGDLINSTKS